MKIKLPTTDKALYKGPMLHGRYQVRQLMEATYVLWDDQAMFGNGILIRRDDGQTEHFLTIAAAQQRADKLSGAKSIPVPVKEAPKVAAAKPSIGKRSMASATRELLQRGGLTDDQIFESVVKEFPTFRRASVDWYRKELAKKS